MTRSENLRAKLIKLGMETAASNGSFPSSIWVSWPDRERNRCRLLKMRWKWGSTLSPQPPDRWMPAEGSKLFRVVWKKVYLSKKSPTKGERAPRVLLKSLSPSKINMLDKKMAWVFFKISINYLLVFLVQFHIWTLGSSSVYLQRVSGTFRLECLWPSPPFS